MDSSQSERALVPLPSDLSGSTLLRFRVIRMLGEGGMGQVYLAEDTTLKRTVAIKRMASGLRSDPAARQRFIKEAQRASALTHPNIAAIYDVFEVGDEAFLVMEYVDGTSLRLRLRREPISQTEFLSIAAQCLSGLGAAHQKRIVHGDIKPENIMLTSDGTAKILDFGVARRATLSDTDSPTQTTDSISGPNSSSGTPAYMAPEVLMEQPHDGRADIFSLGLTFYEMLGGAQPFLTPTLTGTIARVLHSEPPSLRLVNPRVPLPLANIVHRMMAKPLEERYGTCEAVLADLRAFQSGTAISPTPIPATPATKLRLVVVLSIFAVLILAGLLIAIPLIHRASSTKSKPLAIPGMTPSATTTLVILPFEHQSNDPALAADDDGVANVLTAKLTRLSDDHPLQIVSPAEVKAKRVTSLEDARRELGANLGLRLSLQRSADLVRLTFSLLDAASGRILKAGTVDAPAADPFALQDKAADNIASALNIKLRPEEQRELTAHGTASPEAYGYYVQARGYISNPIRPESTDSAVTLLDRALSLDPNYGAAEAALGTAFWSKYDATKDKTFIDKARGACAKAIEFGNAGASGHICLGTLDNGTGQYADAASQFQQAAQLDPTDDDALVGLATAYERLGKRDDAEATYQQIIQRNPTYWRGYNLLGTYYFRQRELDKAAAMMQKVIELTPESFRGYANLGGIYIQQGRYDQGIVPLEKAIRLHPTGPSYSNIAAAYVHLRRYDDAAKNYRESVKLDPENYINVGNLGAAYYWGGKRKEASDTLHQALALIDKALRVNANDADALQHAAYYEELLGDHAEAQQYINKALAHSKNSPDILLTAALVDNHAGQTGPAVEWLQKAVAAGLSPASFQDLPDFDNLRNDPRFNSLLHPAT